MITSIPKVWRLHIRPKESVKGSAKERIRIIQDLIKYVNKRKIIGLAWPLDKKHGVMHLSDPEEYCRLMCNCKGSRSCCDACKKEKKLHPVYSFIKEVNKGDLIWFRDGTGVYYLSQVTSDWEYNGKDEKGIYQRRNAQIQKVDARIPGKLSHHFIPGLTLLKIKNPHIRLYSVYIWNRMAQKEGLPKKHLYDRERVLVEITKHEVLKTIPEEPNASLLNFLSDDDLEDLIALYLQKVFGYNFIPSSREVKSTTPFYEYELLHPHRQERAFVQVKSYGRKFDCASQKDLLKLAKNFIRNLNLDVGQAAKFYIFNTAGYDDSFINYVAKEPEIILLKPETISQFALELYHSKSGAALPTHIKEWIAFWIELKSHLKSA